MITRTTDQVPNKKIVATYGLVRGKGIRARHIGTDIMAGLKGIVGGEIHEYTNLMGEVREQSIDRMIAEAKRIGANPIAGTRLTTSMDMAGAAGLVAYGNAVKVEDVEEKSA